jgi:hypothetical protein
VTIDSNTFNMSGSGTNETIVGIEYSAHNSNGGLSMTVTNNDVFSAGDNSFSGGIVALAGDTGNDDSNTVCNDITGNQSSAAAATLEGDDYVFVKFTGSEFQLENPIVGVLNEAQIDAHIINNDSGTSLATDVTVVAVSGTFSGVNTSCPQ